MIELSSDFLFEILSKRDAEIVSVENVNVEPGVPAFQNFLSQVLKVTVEVKMVDGDKRVMSLMVKTGEQGQSICGFETDKTFFITEAKAYEFLEEVHTFTKSRNKSVEKLWADCLYTAVDSSPYMIMLQDLREIGFRLWPKGLALLDEDHIFIAVETLGKCHAMSRLYVCENSIPVDTFPEPNFKFLCDYLKEGLKVVAKVVTIYDEKWSYISDYLMKSAENFLEKYYENYRSVREDFPVLNLGDCWTTNILFKYSDEDNMKPIDARFIDFQFTYITSFAWDLQYLLFLTLSPKVRMARMNELISCYQKSFAGTMSHLGGDPKLVPSCDQISGIIDKTLFVELVYSTVTVAELSSVTDEEMNSLNNDLTDLSGYIKQEWFLREPESKGYIDNIKYFEDKGLFKQL